MTCKSVQPRDQIIVNGYGFLSFVKIMSKNIGKNISENLSDKSSQKFLDHAKQSDTDWLKTALKRVIQRTAEGTGAFIGKKIADKIHEPQKIHHRNHSGIVESKIENIGFDRNTKRKEYFSRNKTEKYWWSTINVIVIVQYQKRKKFFR